MKATYNIDWPQIALAVKESAGWRCQNCGHLHDPTNGYTLTVHHIDCNSQNDETFNLVALCQRCHLHYQRFQDRRQLTLFGQPSWLKCYFDALGLNSSGL